MRSRILPLFYSIAERIPRLSEKAPALGNPAQILSTILFIRKGVLFDVIMRTEYIIQFTIWITRY